MASAADWLRAKLDETSKEPNHIDAMRALHDSIVNNDAIPDVGHILDRHLPSQSHKDLLQTAAMREAQMTHEGGSASAFDDSLLGNASKAVQSLPEHTAYKLAGLINSDDPHELAAGVKFLDDITKGPEAEEYTLTPEQNIGAVKGLARAAAVIPERILGFPADMVEFGRDALSYGVRKAPMLVSRGRIKEDYNPELLQKFSDAEIPWTSDKLIEKARQYGVAPQETDDPNVMIPEMMGDLMTQFTVAPELAIKGITGAGKLSSKIGPTVKKTTIVTAQPIGFAKAGSVSKVIGALKKVGQAAEEAKAAEKVADLAKAEETTVKLGETHPWTIGVTDSPLSNVKLRVPLSDLTFKTRDIGTLEPKKIIQPSDLMGHVLLPLPADRQVAGKAITEIGGLRLDDAVNQLGGPRYMNLMSKYGQVFANAPHMTLKIVNQARKASDDFSRPVALVYSDMSGQSGDFNTATADLLNKQSKLLDIDPKGIEKLDNHIRTVGGRPDWAGYGTPEGDAQLAEIPSIRKSFVRAMDTKFAQDAGFPSVAHARAATIEPDLLDPVMRAGRSGYTIGLLDPYTAVMNNPVVEHPAFPGVMGGKYLGSLERTVPTGMMYPDLWKKYGVDPSADPDTTNLQTLLYQLDRVIPTSVVDQKMVDELSAHIEKQKKED